ncbi:TetR/AcrR family transcriptional regulator [Actinomadura sp. J1-007]|uniref:TetR/AcrR family transcriptional regulator n=1 Tax=Actinomadura sp. J1-007 TaxID=2661913 RepID=UPI00281539F0|nr:TetR/AcrR family transcriptional regulator [Actinomadura sp. J1-007]
MVDAALEIVTREGGDALSMRRVADALGSAPMSIYRHVRDKDELLTLLMERVVAGLPRPDPPAPPRARLLALLTWQHDELGAHPWIVDVLAKGDLMAPSILWLLEDVYAAWLDCGLTLPQAADANRIAWNLIIGDLVQRTARAASPADKPRDGKPGGTQPAGDQPGGKGPERERAAGAGGTAPASGDGPGAGRVERQVSVPAAADPAVYPTLAALGAYWTAPDRRDRFRDDLATLVNALVDAMAGPDGTGV